MANYRAEGIIIKSRRYAEADKILTLYTKSQGRLTVIAKGARKLKSKKGPHLDLFNHNLFYLAEGKTFDIVTDIKPIKTFSKSKRSLRGISTLYSIADLLDKFTQEGQENLGIFELLKETILEADRISDFDRFSPILFRYQTSLMEKLGFKPELQRCVKCRRVVSEQNRELKFSASSGGVVCNECPIEGVTISPESIKVLRFLVRGTLEEIKKLSLEKKLDGELKMILRFYIEWILEKKLKSVEFLEEAQNEQN